MGIFEHAFGNHDKSIAAYLKALRPDHGARYFSSLDPSISGYKARHNLPWFIRTRTATILPSCSGEWQLPRHPCFGTLGENWASY